MKVALYARVSLEEGNKEDRRYQEPENQLAPLREWARRNNWFVVEEYIDRGSGADPNRPHFKRLLHDAMMLRFNSILVWKADRFTREPLFTAVGRYQKLKERSVGIKSLTEEWLNTSSDNPMSDLILSIMSWAAAEERRKISERTKAGIAQRRAIGQWKGGRPRSTPNPDDVCYKNDQGEWCCKQCDKRFKDNSVFIKKWNFHRRRHEWLEKNNLVEKGGGLTDT